MRALVMAAALLTACSSSEERKQVNLMDDIEKLVELPEEAATLDKYARYYAQNEGKVIALYKTPSFMRHSGEDELQAGQRQWLADHRELPGILDGGCEVIDVVFDPATKEFDRIECNGPS